MLTLFRFNCIRRKKIQKVYQIKTLFPRKTCNRQLIQKHRIIITLKDGAKPFGFTTFSYLPVADDLAPASEGLPEVEGLPSDVLFPIEALDPREVFFSRATGLL